MIIPIGVTQTIGITGIESHVGMRLAGRARAAGYRVRGLDLNGQGVPGAERLHVDVRRADLSAPESFTSFARGLDLIVHAAQAPVEVRDWRTLRRHHVDLVDRLATAARAEKVSRLIQLSSVPLKGDLPEGRVHDTGLYRWSGDPYQQTMLEGERLAMRYHRADSLDVLVLRSADVYGPGALGWVLEPLRLIQRGMMMLPREQKQLMTPVFVDNLCDAVFKGMRTPYTGQAFNVTDDCTLPVNRYVHSLASLAGCRAPVQIPGRLHRVMNRALQRGARTFGRRSPTPFLPARIHGAVRGYTTRNARRLLGHEPRVGLKDGFRHTERWLQGQGIIRR